MPLAYQCLQPVSLMKAESLWNLLRFVVFGRGPLTSNLAEAGAFLKSRPNRPAPDLQFYCAPAYYVDHGLTRPEGHWFTIGSALLRRRAEGASPSAPGTRSSRPPSWRGISSTARTSTPSSRA